MITTDIFHFNFGTVSQRADCDEAGVLDHPPCGTRHFNCGGLRDQHQKMFGVAAPPLPLAMCGGRSSSRASCTICPGVGRYLALIPQAVLAGDAFCSLAVVQDCQIAFMSRH